MACRLAMEHGFDAVNLDCEFLASEGSQAVQETLEAHRLQAAAFRFPVRLTDETSDAEFAEDVRRLETEVAMATAAGFKTAAFHILPFSVRGLTFGEHFRLCRERLATVAPILRDSDLRVGLEFIGSSGLRRVRSHEFLHTVEGIRSLIAAADIESHAPR